MRRFPVDQRLTGGSIPFGGADPNAKFGRHSGIDSANPIGTPVYAPCDGFITNYRSGEYHGLVVQIKAVDGTYPHVFHCSVLKRNIGDFVRVGDLVALSGATGKKITGPHVHFGASRVPVETVTSFDQYINPDEWLKGEDEMQPLIESSHQARVIALEYALDIAGDDPFLARAVGSTELAYRTSLAGMVNNNVNNPNTGYKAQIATLEKQLADAGTGAFEPVSQLFIKKG